MAVSKPMMGFLMCSTAALLWATSGVCGKIVMTGTMSPSRLVFYRSTLGALLLLVGLSLRRPAILKINIRDVPYFMIMGVVGLALTQFTYYAAIQRLNVGLAILLQYLAPLWILLFERLHFKLKIPRSKLVALLMALTGCSLVTSQTLTLTHLGAAGIILGLLAGICFAAYSLMTQHATRSYKELTILFYSLLFSSFFWAIAGPDSWRPLREVEPHKVWILLYIVIFGTLVPYLFFIGAFKHLRASQVGIISTLEPVIATIIAWIFLGEGLKGLQLVGSALVVGAIILLQASPEIFSSQSIVSSAALKVSSPDLPRHDT